MSGIWPVGLAPNSCHSYDSKKETGFVGLKNQGATCYMNSLLQSLFCTRYFRRVRTITPGVYYWSDLRHRLCIKYQQKTISRQRVSRSRCNACSITFRHQINPLVGCILESSGLCCLIQLVGTTELTKSFGWKSLDSFMQHDVQEFNRVLQDKLESKMKVRPLGSCRRFT